MRKWEYQYLQISKSNWEIEINTLVPNYVLETLINLHAI